MANVAAERPGLGRARRRFGRVAQIAGFLVLGAGACFGTLPWARVGWIAFAAVIGQLLLNAWTSKHERDETSPSFARVGDSVAFAYGLLNCAVLALASALLAPVNEVAPQLVLVAVALGIHRVSRRQLPYVAAASTATVLFALSARTVPVGTVDVVTALACLATLGLIGHRMRVIQVLQHTQQDALSTALAQWQVLSRHDALTGALSRRHGSELLEQEDARQQRDRRPFCIGMLDVDHFKRINDCHGHAAGDQVLIELVRLAQKGASSPTKVVRWGGEEFLLLLPGLGKAQAARLLQRVREHVAAQDWSERNPGLVVDVSIGVAEHRPGDTVEATVARADAALYRAKAEGRGRVVQDAS